MCVSRDQIMKCTFPEDVTCTLDSEINCWTVSRFMSVYFEFGINNMNSVALRFSRNLHIHLKKLDK